MLWQALRGRGCVGLKFRRQHPFGRYILDFFCREFALCVEIDSRFHDGDGKHDAARDDFLARHGVMTLRIPAAAVLEDRDAVISAIISAARSHHGVPVPERLQRF